MAIVAFLSLWINIFAKLTGLHIFNVGYIKTCVEPLPMLGFSLKPFSNVDICASNFKIQLFRPTVLALRYQININYANSSGLQPRIIRSEHFSLRHLCKLLRGKDGAEAFGWEQSNSPKSRSQLSGRDYSVTLQQVSWLHRASTILNPLLLPTDAHNVKKRSY